jgi:hypothetical protein
MIGRGLILASVMIGAGLGHAAQAAQPQTVVELFTSQGCSSCPPADAFLGELAKRDDVIALSLHVDYWDYIGWKDSFASKDMTSRQRSYARAMGATGVYTPQAVVGGAAHAVGSDRAAVNALLAKARRNATLALAVERDGQDMVLILPAASPVTATVWLVEFDARHEVPIARGENAGKKLAYHNVVRRLTKISAWDGGAQSLRLPALPPGRGGQAILVQAGDTGPILGAIKVDTSN